MSPRRRVRAHGAPRAVCYACDVRRFAASKGMLGVLLGLGACAPSGTSPADGGESSSSVDGGDVVGCQNDPRAESYTPDFAKKGQAGVFTFTLVSASPAPPGLDQNTWELKVEDLSGNVLTGATLSSVTPWMPDHGHGTSTPQIMTNADGTITVSSLSYFFMTGLWQTTIAAEASGQKDSVTYSFCVGQ